MLNIFLEFRGIIGLLWAVLVILTVIAIIFGKRPRSLNRLAWLILVIFIPFIGVLFYWIFAR